MYDEVGGDGVLSQESLGVRQVAIVVLAIVVMENEGGGDEEKGTCKMK